MVQRLVIIRFAHESTASISDEINDVWQTQEAAHGGLSKVRMSCSSRHRGLMRTIQSFGRGRNIQAQWYNLELRNPPSSFQVAI